MKKKQSLKENPIMVKDKKGKSVKINDFNVDGEDNEVKRFLIIVLVIAVAVGIIYACTELFGEKDVAGKTSTKGEINYDLVNVGMILNRPYDEYYVMIYDGENNEAVKYSSLITNYQQNKNNEDYIKIFYCNLGKEMNKDYYNVGNDSVSNKKPTKTSEFDFGDLTLLKVKNGKITEYIEDYKTIQEKLK